MLSRRSFFKTAGMGAAAAATASFPTELLAWAEPQRAPQPGGPILLNSNENAYGPFPSVLAMKNPFQEANRYPDRSYDGLLERLATLHKVKPDQVLVGAGSTEVLKMAACAFTGPGKKLVMAAPTFEAIGFYGAAVNAEVIKVPLAASYAHQTEQMLEAVGKNGGLIYICNPNNPTASVTPRRSLENLVRQLPSNTYVLMDEAYHDFVPVSADYISFLQTPVDMDRVVVARTFSKIYGMAGLRLGYGVASAKTMKLMAQHKLEDSANIFALRAAQISLEHDDEHEMAVRRNGFDRDEFMRQAATRKLQAITSWTNFVMINAQRPVRAVIDHFKKNNIRVGRPFPPMDTYVRISLGKPEEMKAFWQVWDKQGKLS
ncbi:MAG TPA: aminotransferase class I/II-fold pyridoxal phosphate-dependent enzyme [Candidatus Angelobacter sp.]|nr:aminotransferase class I/II-fold pyridoxal phosphate-dependent enzyme [Candidatus Angelobacter sp.]